MAANNVAGSITSADSKLSPDRKGQMTTKIDEVVSTAVRDQVLGGAVVMASVGGEIVCSKVWGHKTPAGEGGAAVDHGTVFDLGALTSAICTTTLLMRLVDSGRIAITERACRYLQALGVGQKAQITVAQLLSHTSGFGAAPSLYDELVRANSGSRMGILSSSWAKQYAYSQFLKTNLRYEPNHRFLKSEINSILLGQIVENATGMSLERAFQKYVASPLQLKSLGFIDVAMLRRRNLAPATEIFMPSGVCSKRERIVAGEAWDENAYVMGGVAGHSGLFGTARDVHAWGVEVLRSILGESELITQRTALSFWEPVVIGAKSVTRFGFEFPELTSGFVSGDVSPNAGVVSNSLGSSVLIDPDKKAVVVVLSNADYSGSHNRRFVDVKGDIHSAILQ
jgi:CubicO group peptidase (beta-lactamase class C family)